MDLCVVKIVKVVALLKYMAKLFHRHFEHYDYMPETNSNFLLRKY